MKALISSKLIQETRERIKEDMAKDQSIKEELMQPIQITASIVIKAGSFCLNEDVFKARKETKKQKKHTMIKKIKREEAKYQKSVIASERVWDKRDKVEDITIRELTDI